MEMNSIISQMSEMFSANIAEELTAKSGQYNAKTESFETVMSARLNEADKTEVKAEVKTGATRTVSDKRQTEMTRKDDSLNVKQDAKSGVVKDSTQEKSVIQKDGASKLEKEVVSEWKEDVKMQICDDLDITLEELENIMSQLGLQITDLQDVTNLQQVVLTVVGESDSMLLLTDEGLGKSFQKLVEDVATITQEMQEKFSISEDEFSTLLSKDNESVLVDIPLQTTEADEEKQDIVSNEQEMVTPEENVFLQDDVTNLKIVEEEPVLQEEVLDSSQKPEQEKDASTEKEQLLSVIEKPEMVEALVENAEKEEPEELFVGSEVKTEKTESTESIKIEISTEGMEQKHADKEQNTATDGNNEQSIFEQFMSHLTMEKVNITENVTDRVAVAEQMREIVNQVVEQIKITVNADTSAMEIQLNPENLGKVSLSVVAKEGHITAQFVTESEMSKYALEGQLQQLRETLGEQGLKVDEVEVTVSNFDFSQSNQANAEEQKQQQQSEFSKRVTRNLNMNNIDSMEELTEEEQLAAKIMQLNGNQIDYTA